MPPCLVHKTLCESKQTCIGEGRRDDIQWPPPGYDYEYSLTDVCLLCRFDTEINWFMEIFSFAKDA